jgi:hypothetical protein
MLLGKLGHLIWFRCRECGIDYAVPFDNDAYPDCPCCGAEIGDDDWDAMRSSLNAPEEFDR